MMLNSILKTVIISSIIIVAANEFAFSNDEKNLNNNNKLFLAVDRIYVPVDYKSGDNLELMLTGILPNLCYQDVNSEVEILDDVKTIKVSLWSHGPDSFLADGKNIFCAQVVRPYVQKINVGSVTDGTYVIEVNQKPILPLLNL